MEAPAQDGAPPREAAGQATDDVDRLRASIFISVDANDENLGAVSARVRRVTEDRTVKEAKTVTVKVPSGGSISYRKSPRSEYNYIFTFDCEKSKCDESDEAGRTSRTWTYDGTTWTQYDPAKKLAMIRRPDQMAAQYPFDPREVVMDDIRMPLRRFVRMSKVGPLRGKSGLLRAEWTDDEGQRLAVDFDPEFGLLPVGSVSYRSDGSILASTQANYQRVPKRNAFVLEKSVTRFFPKGTRDLDAEWVKSMTTTLMDIRLIDKESAKAALALNLPAKIRLSDLTVPTPRPAVKVSAPPRLGPIVFVIVNVMLLAIVLISQKLRRKRVAKVA